MLAIPRVDVLGVGISAVNPRTALEEITRWIDTGERSYVCVTGVHGVMESQRDPELLRIHNRSGLTVPDGTPMVWAGRRAGAQSMSRVYGPDLMLDVLARAAQRGWTSYLYGGRQGVPELLAERLSGRFHGLKIVGAYSPPFRPLTPGEEAEVADRINTSGADLVWVGLSTPKLGTARSSPPCTTTARCAQGRTSTERAPPAPAVRTATAGRAYGTAATGTPGPPPHRSPGPTAGVLPVIRCCAVQTASSCCPSSAAGCTYGPVSRPNAPY